MTFTKEKLGINIHVAGIRHFGLDVKKTIQTILELPYKHVRIPIPFDEIVPQKGTWDFSKRDWLIEQAIKHDKTIHLQFGAKTIGFPEVWLPTWLTDTHPYIHKAYACIDDNQQVREFLLETLAVALQRYSGIHNLGSLQIENEAFCRRLSVANYRYISFDFHQQELAVVRKYTKAKIPVLQNLPLNHLLDMLQSMPYVFKNSDIIGLNIYNQHIASSFIQTLHNATLHTGLPAIQLVAKLGKKKLYVTELQTAAWLSGGKPVVPFSEKVFMKTLQHCFQNGAEIVFLWDIEQLLKNGSEKFLENLY